MYKVLIIPLIQIAQEKSVAMYSDRPDMTIAVDWGVKHQTEPNKAEHFDMFDKISLIRSFFFHLVQNDR